MELRLMFSFLCCAPTYFGRLLGVLMSAGRYLGLQQYRVELRTRTERAGARGPSLRV